MAFASNATHPFTRKEISQKIECSYVSETNQSFNTSLTLYACKAINVMLKSRKVSD